MMRFSIIGFAAALFLMPFQYAFAAVDLVPHRALYKMTLVEASSRSGITGAQGAMMYRFEDACDAWTSETKVLLRMVYNEGEEVETTWSFTSWEAKNGLSYRFNVRQDRNGDSIEVLEGAVQRETPEGAAVALFSNPKDTKIVLPKGTLFPTQHLAGLLEAAQKNKLTVSKVVFDGASLENPYQINALITKPSAQESKTKSARHIRMAFFPIHVKNEEPDFELGITYRPDGVAEFIRQDFAGFSLDLEANSIEVLKKPDC